jgi:hypothetical protein
VDAVEPGDRIKTITVDGDVETLLERQAERIATWDATLAREFPELG